MDWYGIGFSAIAGGIGAWIGYLIVPGHVREKAVGKVIFAVAIALAVVLSQTFIVPELRASREQAAIEKGIAGNPAVEAIRDAAPDTYSNMIRDAMAARKSGKSDIEIQTVIRKHLYDLLSQRMPYSSDDALLNTLDLMVDQLVLLSEKNDTWCVRLMYPDPVTGVGFDPVAVFPPAMMERDFENSAHVIRSYNPNRQHAPAEFAWRIVEPISKAILEKYGEQALLLPDQDPSLTCQAVIELLSRVSDLPPLDRAVAFRYLISE